MSENQLLPDDPRLTAYALGELDPTEVKAVEQLLAASPAAQCALQEIRELAGLLTSELRDEPAPALTETQRAAILGGSAAMPAPRPATIPARTRGSRTMWFASLATMAALCVVAVLVLPKSNRTSDRELAELQWHEQTDGKAFSEVVVKLQQSTAGDANDEDRQISVDKLRILVRNAEVRAERLAETNPTQALTLIDKARTNVANSALEKNESKPLLNSLAKSQLRVESVDNVLSSKGNPRYNYDSSAATGLTRESAEQLFEPDVTGAGDKVGLGTEVTSLSATSGAGVTGTTGGGPAKGPKGEWKDQSGDESKRIGKPASGGGSSVAQRVNEGVSSSLPDVKMTTELERRSGGTENITVKDNPSGGPKYSFGQRQKEGEKKDAGLGYYSPRDRKSSSNVKGLVPHPAVQKGNKRLMAGVESAPAADFAEESEQRYAGGFGGLGGGGIARGVQARPGPGPGDSKFSSFYTDTYEVQNEGYDPIVENLFLSSYENPLSTFGVDVDTASYSNVRRFLTQRQRPPQNAVRIEELVNYFSYDYPQPTDERPFSVNIEVGRCPWYPPHSLVRIGLKGREIDRNKRPASNLVFLVDVSGSMQAENKLPLVKMGLNLLTQQMAESDRVAIVTYSDTAVQRLESTNGTNKEAILGVVNGLQAGGSTNGAGGIQLAYRAALDHFITGGTNRVILLTDGDFNVGVTGDDELVKLIEERARTKVFFSVFGFGMGNLKDGKLEKLADKGNGQYAYVDNQKEARKVFVEDLAGTLVTIAKDVKIQVEFNPNQIGNYRLIGYENRVMAAQDFHNDAKDAGDIGAGHTVTALYEITQAGPVPKPQLGDTLRYRAAVVPQEGALSRELLTVKLRYKLPEGDTSTLFEVPFNDPRPGPQGGVGGAGSSPAPPPSMPQASRDFNWASAVAAFGMLLRDSQFRGQANFDMVLELARAAVGEDKGGHRKEFIELVEAAKAMSVGTSPVVDNTFDGPPPVPAAVVLTREQAEAKASLVGKYKNLLRIVEAPGDAAAYGAVRDFGYWEGTTYAGQNDLPKGYWVYVAPNWYIWGDTTQRRE